MNNLKTAPTAEEFQLLYPGLPSESYLHDLAAQTIFYQGFVGDYSPLVPISRVSEANRDQELPRMLKTPTN